MLRARDLRVLDEDELEVKLRELKETLFNLRFQHATGQLDNPMKIRETRRDIARVCTAMSELKYGILPVGGELEGPAAEPLLEAAGRAGLEAELEPEEASEEAAEGGADLVGETGEQLEEEIEEELEDK